MKRCSGAITSLVLISLGLPLPAEAQNAGSCTVYRRQGNIKPDTVFRWIGPCTNGFAEGEGYFLREDAAGQQRSIVRLGMVEGSSSGSWTMYASFPGDKLFKMEFDGRTARPSPITARDLPAWTVSYLTNGDVGDLGPSLHRHIADVRPEEVAVREARERQEARARAESDAREREEVLAAIERRTRESEEIDRQMAQERRDRREARGRELTDAMQSALQGAAALRQQQSSENARLQAERQRIERDNERYRQQRTEQERQAQRQQQLAASQRQQQAALETQRVEQERQRAQEERRRTPRKERVNLPKHTNCIRFEWVPNSGRDYWLHNSCAYPLEVHWCEKAGCQRATDASRIASGGRVRGVLLGRENAVRVLAACQLDNGGADLFYDHDGNQCWSWVTMQ
jgi:hypothetical protein